MNTFLELHVELNDGTAFVSTVYLNDAIGRRRADRDAQRLIAYPNVISVAVLPTDRIAQGSTVEGRER